MLGLLKSGGRKNLPLPYDLYTLWDYLFVYCVRIAGAMDFKIYCKVDLHVIILRIGNDLSLEFRVEKERG